ncbi:AGE family epimerase/isomerase [Persicitalea jodogahamensis]|uniref:N-acylglucosamine 2-epimerase n=1 Tax=Persicitalea jodogahamensis TaxID=402147 RepID=A0A8J3D0L2_9BACT|nr:AGE family epimerase/isomerase [Persicitalea jodogahamensis]GHB53062.1 N-acylglucosamine 2-epimerase [Persicitalea jodogahamensis]
MDIKKLAEQYRHELTQNILPFWESHAFDPQYGGVFEALDERGEIISTDKPVALQAQAAWAFAFAYNQLGPNPAWLELAQKTVHFLLEKGRDAKGNWYQQLDRRGTSLSKATDHFPALYATLALSQLAQATGGDAYADDVQKTLARVLRKRDSSLKKQKENPGGGPSGGGTPIGRAFKNLEEFALIGHALLASESYADKKWFQKTLNGYVAELTDDFYDKRSDILLENITPEGHFWDCPAGRTLVPGRVFEVANFMMDIADRTRNRKLLNQMLDLTELTVRAAWDEASGEASPGEASPGGFYYRMDLKGKPPLEPRWNHKLAWVQLEALQTLMKAHLLSARPVFLEMFEQTHEYVWAHFPDLASGGWFTELSQKGEPFVRHKVLPDNGFFSLVKNLANVATLLEIARGKGKQRVG